MKTESAEMKFLCLIAGYTLLGQKLCINIHSKLRKLNSTERTKSQQGNWYENIIK
jgi:hypothetical protein